MLPYYRNAMAHSLPPFSSTSATEPAVRNDTVYLQLALQQAQLAAAMDEVPVGAVLVAPDGQVLAQAHNRTLADNDPSAHAEMLALRWGAQKLGNHRLEGCTLYITLEPCAMCSGAMLHARPSRVVYAVPDPKTGAAGSVLNVFAHRQINHQTAVEAFMPTNAAERALQAGCAQILSAFFQKRRTAYQTRREQAAHAPVREDALRPAAQHFQNLAPLQALQPYSRFALLNDPDASSATLPWRMHYWDTGDTGDIAPKPPEKPAVVLLHGYASYNLLWAQWLPVLQQAGWRVLAPDLPGHGQSDQPKKTSKHQIAWHAQLLQKWLQQVGFARHSHGVLLAHDSAALLLPDLLQALHLPFPLQVLHLASAHDERPWRTHCMQQPGFDLDKHWALNTEELAQKAWSAPYPNAGHRAALRWAQWAQWAPPQAFSETIKPYHQHTWHSEPVPASGVSFRLWLGQNSSYLLKRLQALHAGNAGIVS